MDELEAIVKSEAGLRDLLESIDDLVAFATLEGRLLYVNRAWREKLGYTEGEVAGLSSYDIIHPSQQSEVEATNAKLMASEQVVRVERLLVAKDGRQIPVDGSLSCRFKDGKPWYVRAIFHDITARKAAERMKDDLVSMASHELRNPLMAIRTALHLLNEELVPTKLERPVQVVGLAMRNCDRMVDLIKAYLDLANLEAGARLKESEVDVSGFIDRIVELNQPLGLHAGVDIRHESTPGAKVLGDEDRLAQVLTNLLSNAIKFSKPGGSVQVRSEFRDGHVRVTVSDQGDGIPESFRAKIFGKFAQAEGHARGGSGLGLAISKAIVEKHGGRIGFETALGQGTTFYFELPKLG
ncbi:MAG: PAS domain-containing sensor histidine kinase [Elusimicrobia bacterium]|nr:PAS domain-containing sensor histidine kinase [Elusimicrobiota bacterium]